MYRLFLEVDKDFLINQAYTHNISRNAMIISVAKDFDKLHNMIHFVTKDFKGTNRPHHCSIQFPDTPYSYRDAIDLFLNSDLKVKCDCEDFKYRRAYKATMLGYNAYPVNELRPAKITNPLNKGSVCKHLLNVLKNFEALAKYVKYPPPPKGESDEDSE